MDNNTTIKTIRQFAQAYGFTERAIKRDAAKSEGGEQFLAGSAGQIYRYGGGKFAVLFMGYKKHRLAENGTNEDGSIRVPGKGTWNARRKALVKLGGKVQQDGDAEGVILFDPNNKAAAMFAAHVMARVRKAKGNNADPNRPKRVLSAEHLAKLAEGRERARVAKAMGVGA